MVARLARTPNNRQQIRHLGKEAPGNRQLQRQPGQQKTPARQHAATKAARLIKGTRQ